jgi:hypothetical protein
MKWVDIQEDYNSPSCPMCRTEFKPLSVLSRNESKAEYIVKQMHKWVNDLKETYETYEEQCEAIHASFGSHPEIAAALITKLS